MAVLDERDAVRRLYDRFGFGPRPGELDAGKGFDAVLAALLDPAAAASGKATPAPQVALPGKKDKKDKADAAAKKQANAQVRDQSVQVVTWWLDRMVAADVASGERLTWFWHGHFATSEQKVKSPALMLAQNETQRRLAMGGFTELAKAMVVDPAMLLWLDGNSNKVGSPNENLAREFMELFALGVGHYSETDVREAARVLTGWTAQRDLAGAKFVPKRHDGGSKQLLGSTGDFDAQSFVDVVLNRPDSARFIADRLWFRLVSATPPAADVLDRLVSAYGQGRDIRALLTAIAREPAFRDAATTLVKQPVEWLVGLMRALGVRPGKLDAKTMTQVLAGLRGMGQVPFEPPSVGGWAAGGAWLTTSAGVARLHLAQLVTAKADLSAVTGSKDPVEAIRSVLGVSAWSDRTRTALSGIGKDAKQLSTVAACAPEYVVSG
jgi:uncharacterized protein (DUF1800 family)